MEDIVQVGTIDLIKAIDRFDLEGPSRMPRPTPAGALDVPESRQVRFSRSTAIT